MTKQIVPRSEKSVIAPPELIADLAAKNRRTAKSVLLKYDKWLNDTGRQWYTPDLAADRDILLEGGRSPATVNSQLSAIRGRYQALLRDNTTRQAFYDMAPADAGPADKKAFVDELTTRINNAIDPQQTSAKETTIQDRPQSDFHRLTGQQARELIEAPGLDTLKGLRDSAVIAMLLCTGLREKELSDLNVSDLEVRTQDDKLAVIVRHGKGNKQRLIPYGRLDFCLTIVKSWLFHAGITEGPVFRGLYKGGKKIRPGRLSVRAIEYILAEYPIAIEGQPVHVKPHDCRRTYARLLYDAGLPIIAIQQNLGHADHKTTELYIGVMDSEKREPPKVIPYDVGKVATVPMTFAEYDATQQPGKIDGKTPRQHLLDHATRRAGRIQGRQTYIQDGQPTWERQGYYNLAHMACESVLDGAGRAKPGTLDHAMREYYTSATEKQLDRLFGQIERAVNQ